MKTVSIAIALIALSSINAFASQDPCEAPAIASAKKWAKAHGVRGTQTFVSNFGQDEQGHSIYEVQLSDPKLGGDCWTNIAVTVQENANDTCVALHTEEDLNAESCS